MVKSVLRPDDEALFSASSLSWQVNRNWFPLLGGARAAILQVCDPLVAAGVASYSTFRTDPFGRLDRTLDAMLTISFASPERRDEMLERLRRGHARVVGTTEAGDRYDANDPELQYWVLATLVDTTFEVERRYVGVMSRSDRERFFQESKLLARAFGIAEEHIPADLDAFRSYMAHKFATLEPSDATRQVTRALMRPGLRWVPDQSFVPLNWVTAELLPSRLRGKLGVEDLNSAELAAVRSARLMARSTLPRLHHALTTNPWSTRVLRAAA
ncbi:MAG TPA: oxygenase MpaB family protein [Microthrixaceae bacterium]|jgi:uncharacterized protein (DUF2236 family)|nr:oxygenase MpaB family protein [Microthrixaceae bacterium]